MPPASPHVTSPRILVLSCTVGETSSANQSTPRCSFPPPPSCSSTKHTRSEQSGARKGQGEDTRSCPGTPQGSRRSQISSLAPLPGKYLQKYQSSVNTLQTLFIINYAIIDANDEIRPVFPMETNFNGQEQTCIMPVPKLRGTKGSCI